MISATPRNTPIFFKWPTSIKISRRKNMYRKESRGKKSNILTTRRSASLLRVRYQYFFSIIHSNLGLSMRPRSPLWRWRGSLSQTIWNNNNNNNSNNNNNNNNDNNNNNSNKNSSYSSSFVFFMKYSLVLYIFITWTQRKFLYALR